MSLCLSPGSSVGPGLSPTLVGPGPHGYLRTPLFSIKDVGSGILAPRALVSHSLLLSTRGFPGGSVVKNPPAIQETQKIRVPSLGHEDPLEEGMATHSRILAWRIPWTVALQALLSMGLHRIRHD